MTTTAADLLARHTRRWGFRRRGPFEGAQQYRDAAIAYLETRDWAAAHEVRLDRPQADWTAADAQAFADRINTFRRSPKDRDRPVAHVFLEAGTVPCTIAGLLDVAAAGLDELAGRRRADVRASLPIFAHAIRLDGRMGLTTVSSDERFAVLKAAARTMPLYGYVLVFDAFVHAIDAVGTDQTRATKRDALLAHVGTRDDRRIVTRRYTVTGRRVVFDPQDTMDVRHLEPGARIEDPYAELFVTVPAPERAQ